MLAKNLLEWSRLVRERDNYICQWCGEPADLAHHVKDFREFPELRFETDNGISLNYKCHGLTWRGKRPKEPKRILANGFTLHKRSLHRIGNISFGITLPVEFIKHNALNNGDEVQLYFSDSCMLIVPIPSAISNDKLDLIKKILE